MKKFVKKLIKKIKNNFSKKIPVEYPVLNGNLLENRVALITGGSSGIGFAIAKVFLKQGCSCIITGRNEKRIIEAKEKLKEYCKNENFIEGYVFDISDIDEIQNNFDKIIKNTNRNIDIFVNNAGIQKGAIIGNTSKDDFEEVIKTNLEGTYFLSQSIMNYMINNKIKGNILNILSSSSRRPAVVPYSISKWGEEGLTIGLAKKCVEYGIVVNAIAPGPTATKMLVNEEDDDITNNNSPIKRYIMPEEVANIAVVLVSSLGKAIIGDTVYMTGGSAVITVDDIGY